MKFLMFNVVVGAALIFLFTSDKVEFQSAADTTHAVAQELKETAKAVLDQPEAVQTPRAKMPQRKMPVRQVAEAKEDEVTVAAIPDDLTRLADELDRLSFEDQALSPEVAKRRAQIMQTESDDESFVIDRREDRHEKLQSLSEEMELFSAEITVQ